MTGLRLVTHIAIHVAALGSWISGNAVFATGPKEIVALLTRWRDQPDLDDNYVDVGRIPPELLGDWLVLAESKDEGNSIDQLSEPRLFMRVDEHGWLSGDAPPGTAVASFQKIFQQKKEPTASAWFLATGQNRPFLLVHLPGDSSYALVRELELGGSAETLVERRRYAISFNRGDADEKTTQNSNADAEKREQLKVVRGELGVSGWGSWKKSPEAFTSEFEKRNLRPTSGKGLFIRSLDDVHVDGLMVNDILVRINGIHLTDEASWAKAMGSLNAQEDAKVVIKRSEDGGPWKTITLSIKPIDADRVADARKRKEEENRRKQAEAEESRKKSVFKLADGSTVTGAQVDEYNERVREKLVRQALAMDVETLLRVRRGKAVLDAAVSHYQSGNTKALADLVSQVSSSGAGKDIEEYVFLRTDYDDLLVCLKDGRAITYEKLWGEAVVAAARAMNP
jgi:hypothetical protein